MIEVPPPRAVRFAGLVVAIALTALSIWLHLSYRAHAGPLWRDEINSVNVAAAPTLSEMWAQGEFDSFPIAWHLALRGWAVRGSSDADLRDLGLVVGIALLGALWGCAGGLGRSAPLVSLALVGLAPQIVRWGDNLRAYGLGSCALLLCLAAIWQVVRRPGPTTVSVAALAAVLSVQCLYHNAVLVGAVGLGGIVVCLRRRMWERAGLIAGIGLVAAVSLLPYLSTFRRIEQWNMLVKEPVSFTTVLESFRTLLGPQGALAAAWAAAVGLAIVAALLAQLRRFTPGLAPDRRDLGLYLGTALIAGLTTYAVFLWWLGYPPQPWYLFAAAVFAAAAADALLALLVRGLRARIARAAAVAALAALLFSPALADLRLRQTNIDRIAEDLNGRAAAGDMIVVHPWYFGLTFDRYYRGAAAWDTIPPIGSHRVHRFDLLKERIASSSPIEDLAGKCAGALRSGHRVWIVGGLPAVPPGGVPPYLPPPRLETDRWHVWLYTDAWALNMSFLLQHHSQEIQVFRFGGDVNPYEEGVLLEIEGWRR